MWRKPRFQMRKSHYCNFLIHASGDIKEFYKTCQHSLKMRGLSKGREQVCPIAVKKLIVDSERENRLNLARSSRIVSGGAAIPNTPPSETGEILPATQVPSSSVDPLHPLTQPQPQPTLNSTVFPEPPHGSISEPSGVPTAFRPQRILAVDVLNTYSVQSPLVASPLVASPLFASPADIGPSTVHPLSPLATHQTGPETILGSSGGEESLAPLPPNEESRLGNGSLHTSDNETPIQHSHAASIHSSEETRQISDNLLLPILQELVVTNRHLSRRIEALEAERSGISFC